MRTLNPQLDFNVCTIKESKKVSVMNIEDLQISLEARELNVVERRAKISVQQAPPAQTNKKYGHDKKKMEEGQRKIQ